MNIALFGGSFDPPHIGHEEIVNKVLQKLDIEKLIIEPSFLNPFKSKSYFSPQDRFNLVNELFSQNDKIVVDNFELKQNKPTPTIETIEYLVSKYNPSKIYLIVGADNLKSLHLWQDFDKLKQLVTYVSISRDGYEEKNDIIQTIDIKLDINISSTTLRENLNLKYIPKKIEQKVRQLWIKNKEFKI